jgi:hypothetical protein
VRFDALTLVVRPRSASEAVDLGLRLSQVHRWAATQALMFPLIPVVLCAEALDLLIPDHGWIWLLCVWWFKPLYDRFALMVFAQAVFGEATSLAALRRALPQLLRSGTFRALTWARFGEARSFALPVRQLEGLRGAAAHARTRLLLRNWSGSALRLLTGCALLETVALMGLLATVVQLLPGALSDDIGTLLSRSGESGWLAYLERGAYLIAMVLIEPFYVAAGFALYLSRRTELEGWDIELAFRAMASRLAQQDLPA